jgi:putative transcriptional regulator
MIVYDKLFKKLDEAGLTSYKLKLMSEPLIAQATLTRLKKGIGGVDHSTLDRLCKYFDCQPGDLMEYVEDKKQPPD